MGSLFNGAEVRFCVRRLHANFKKEYHGLLIKQLWWTAAKATTNEEWVRRMNELKEVDENVYKWLSAKKPAKWTKSHFREFLKCDMLLNKE